MAWDPNGISEATGAHDLGPAASKQLVGGGNFFLPALSRGRWSKSGEKHPGAAMI